MTESSTCERCRRRDAGYRWSDGGALRAVCLRCFVRSRSNVRRAGVTALVVGTLLTLINHRDALLAANLEPAHLWKIPLTYAVPYLVTTWGALGAARARRPG